MALVTANLVAEWVAKLATGSGPPSNDPLTTTWADNVGSNDLTLYTGSGGFAGTADSGWDGDGSAGDPYCLVADTTNDYCTCTSSPISSDADFTVELWCYAPDVTSSSVSIFAQHSGNYGVRLYLDGATDRMGAQIGTGSGLAYPANSSGVGYGEWLHMVLTYDADGDVAYLYRNANQGSAKSTEFSPNAGTGLFWVAATKALAGTKIATCRIYSSTLSSDDVAANYAAGVTAASTDSSATFLPRVMTHHFYPPLIGGR